MLMLALPAIGLLALRCVDALAPLFILLFNFFDLLTIGTLILNLQLCLVLRDARPLSHLLLDLHPALLLLLLLDFQLLILLLTLFDGSRRGRSRRPLLRSSRRSDPAAATGGGDYGMCCAFAPAARAAAGRDERSRRRQLCGSCGGVGSSPTLPVPL